MFLITDDDSLVIQKVKNLRVDVGWVGGEGDSVWITHLNVNNNDWYDGWSYHQGKKTLSEDIMWIEFSWEIVNTKVKEDNPTQSFPSRREDKESK